MKRSLSSLTAAILVAVTLQFITFVATGSPAQADPAHRILITGDSITQGSSGDYTWRYRLWNKLATTAPGNVAFVGTRTDLFDVVNNVHGSNHYAATFGAKAHSAKWGDSFTQELGQIGSQVASSNANVLVVALGSNDLAYLTSPQETIANLTTYIQQARAARPGIDVVVSEVVNRWNPWTQAHEITTQVDQYAALLPSMVAQLNTASERVVIAATRTGWNAQIHTWDGTHPNPTGEALIAQRISEGLAQLGIGAAAPNIATSRAWNVSGPAPSATAGVEKVNLGWSRVSTGSTGMFIEMKLVNTGQAWNRLPYAISGNGWTVDILAAGGTYDFRLVPSKGFLTGVAGTEARRTVSGPSLPNVGSVTPVSRDYGSYGSQKIGVSWTASSNATAYNVAQRKLSNGLTDTWEYFPYPVTGTSWNFDLLFAGRFYDFRVQPNRGFTNGNWTGSSALRTWGIDLDRDIYAVGDSYTAGTGTDPTNAPPGQGCARGPHAWPHQLKVPQGNATMVACAGATTADMPTQAGAAGYLSAHNASGHARQVVMTIGGNDIGFTDIIKACVSIWSSCTSLHNSTITKINNLQGTLIATYANLRENFPYADILVGGYPTPVQPGGRNDPFLDAYACAQIGPNERAMADDLAYRLNQAIQQAAYATSASIWPTGQRVRTKFQGHGACSANGFDDWIHNRVDTEGVTELVAMNSFHPNSAGQAAYGIVFNDLLQDIAWP